MWRINGHPIHIRCRLNSDVMSNLHMFSKLHTAGIKHYIEPASPKESEVGVYTCIRNLLPYLLVVEHKVKASNCDVDIDR